MLGDLLNSLDINIYVSQQSEVKLLFIMIKIITMKNFHYYHKKLFFFRKGNSNSNKPFQLIFELRNTEKYYLFIGIQRSLFKFMPAA